MTHAVPPSGKLKTAIILLAHGAPLRVQDIPKYLKNIRSGTNSSTAVIQEVASRYKQIGGRSPLLDITTAQAEALETYLNQGEDVFKVYVGMRTWSPYIKDAVNQAVNDGAERIVALCLAPQYSRWSTERYQKAFYDAMDVWRSKKIEVQFITSWPNQPLLVVAFVERYDEKAGIGTVIATMLPYTVVFLVVWIVLLVIWMLVGFPVGPGAPIYLPS
jgi:ferrochelatase